MPTLYNQHERFTPQMRNRLKTTVMGLGLVRLLQDARRTEEAQATLGWLQEAGVVSESGLGTATHSESSQQDRRSGSRGIVPVSASFGRVRSSHPAALAGVR